MYGTSFMFQLAANVNISDVNKFMYSTVAAYTYTYFVDKGIYVFLALFAGNIRVYATGFMFVLLDGGILACVYQTSKQVMTGVLSRSNFKKSLILLAMSPATFGMIVTESDAMIVAIFLLYAGLMLFTRRKFIAAGLSLGACGLFSSYLFLLTMFFLIFTIHRERATIAAKYFAGFIIPIGTVLIIVASNAYIDQFIIPFFTLNVHDTIFDTTLLSLLLDINNSGMDYSGMGFLACIGIFMVCFVMNAIRATKATFTSCLLRAAILVCLMKDDFSFVQLAWLLPIASLQAGDDDRFSRNIIMSCFYLILSDCIFYFILSAAGAQAMISMMGQTNQAIIFVRLLQLVGFTGLMIWWITVKPSMNGHLSITTMQMQENPFQSL
jgi:hypothetical protein